MRATAFPRRIRLSALPIGLALFALLLFTLPLTAGEQDAAEQQADQTATDETATDQPATDSPATAPAPPTATIQPLAVSFTDSGLSGPGAGPILDALTDSQFVLVGEDHGFAGAPHLVVALAAAGREHGLDHYAIEVGPESTGWIAAQLAAGGVDAYAEAMADRPLAVPFLNLREEAVAALPFARTGALWGVDQEFVASTLLHFEWLAERAADPAAREHATALLAAERAAVESGDPGGFLILRAESGDWDELDRLFADDPEALQRIDALRASSAIYRHYSAGRGLDNNLDRVALIRRTFLDQYQVAAAADADGEPPRVLLKMGAVHAGHATSDLNTFDLGSLLPGVAAAHGLRTLHLAYLPLGGSALALQPSAEGWFTTRPVEAAELRAVLQAAGVDLAPIDDADGHFVVDLEAVRRALGNRGLADLDRMTRYVVLGFDVLVTTRAATPASPLSEP